MEKALDAHYANLIDLHDYWSVGDTKIIEREVDNPDYNRNDLWNIYWVILDTNGKELATPINGHTKSAFVIGTKYVLWKYAAISETARQAELIKKNYDDNADTNSHYYEKGSNNYSHVYKGNWNSSTLREWINNDFANVVISENEWTSNFKQHYNVSAKSYFNESDESYSTETITTLDYFAIPAATELFGDDVPNYIDRNNVDILVGAEQELYQFEYYKSSINRLDFEPPQVDTSADEYMLRSLAVYKNGDYYMTNISGYAGSDTNIPDKISSTASKNDTDETVLLFGVI